MAILDPAERKKLERRIEEIDAQILNLHSFVELSLAERQTLRLQLTREWLVTYKKLTGLPV